MGSLKGSCQEDLGVSKNIRVPYFGVHIIRILLFRVLN